MLAALLAWCSGSAAADGAGAVDPEIAQLRAALGVARTDSFCLVLDLHRAELRLMLGGVPLRTLAYTEAAVGSPQVGFLARPVPADWTAKVWREGTLHPSRRSERLELTPPPPGGGAAQPVLPPLPTEGPPPPARYVVRFAGGLELEIRRPGAPRATGAGERLRLLARPHGARVRVRLTLADADATDLYRSLPPRVMLVVLGRPA